MNKDRQSFVGEILHGYTGTNLYICWKNMTNRCRNPNATHYHRYGGRGIKVCEEWLTFRIFLTWANISGYSEDLTIDRINNDKNYEPSNCRWVTKQENHYEMMQRSLIEKEGIFSKNSLEKAKKTNQDLYGKKTLVSKYNESVVFGSRGEATDYLIEKLGRSRSSVKAQITICLNPNSKCKTIGGYKIENID